MMLGHSLPHRHSESVTTAANAQQDERTRVRELLRYFQPEIPLVDASKRIRVSSDPSLTAYAQLAAWRLNCQRSFISLVDHDKQYIIAEATRTVSLTSDAVFDGPDDAIFLGPTTLDLIWGMCAATIPTFTCNDGSLDIAGPYMKTNKQSFVIHDMSKVDAYKDRPYVTGWPHMRYYAEVPISSPTGLCIGSICTVDDKPRDCLDPKEITILQEIAATVMDHLDLVMSRVQRGRAQQMIRGLGIFADAGGTNPVLRQQLNGIERREDNILKESIPESAENPSNSQESLVDADYSCEPVLQTLVQPVILKLENSQGSSVIASQITKQPSDEDKNTQLEYFDYWQESNTALSHSHGIVESTLQVETPSLELMNRITGAANLIREAVDLEGIIFFDQRLQNFRDMLDDNQSQIDSVFYAERERDKLNRHANKNPAKTLTFSGIIPDCSNDFQISEELLSSMITKFPHGGVLLFDRNGECESYVKFEVATSFPMAVQGLLRFSEPVGMDKAKYADLALIDETSMLNRSFGSRAMILFPVKSSSADNLFAYAIGFTSAATKTFQNEDLAYLASFSNLLTIELSRLDVMAADRAKAEFISSISHELRSPLHGILASAELLKDHVKTSTSTEIFNTIDACGSTLVDTLDDLLTFTKINNLTVKEHQQQEKLLSVIDQPPTIAKHRKHHLSLVDLSELVEEVMSSAIAGHHMRTDISANPSPYTPSVAGKTPHKSYLSVICDVQKGIDWQFSTQTGAWKRILMNLLGNSLKYTFVGFIRVRLRLQEKKVQYTPGKEYYAILTVEDTGCGISETFLKTSLYKPFKQENSLQPGTGLGLSIVRQLVENIDGRIEVTSEVQRGTIVTVTAKLTRTKDSALKSPLESLPLSLSRSGSRRKVGFLGFDQARTLTSLPVQELKKAVDRELALKTSLTLAIQEFGFQTVSSSTVASKDVDILLMPEDANQGFNENPLVARTRPLILLCAAVKLDYRRAVIGSDEESPIFYLSQPFCSRSLCQALEYCFNYNSDVVAGKVEGSLQKDILKSDERLVSRTVESPAAVSLTRLSVEPEAVDNSSVVVNCPKALLVEDNPVNLKLLIMFMKKLNYIYKTATDGQEAVDIYRSAAGAFNIIITDIQMPNKDGFIATKEIRLYETHYSLNRTPIIAVTGLGAPETIEEAISCGVDQLLTKPVTLKALKKSLQVYLPPSEPL